MQDLDHDHTARVEQKFECRLSESCSVKENLSSTVAMFVRVIGRVSFVRPDTLRLLLKELGNHHSRICRW